jgi:hypothetical protein
VIARLVLAFLLTACVAVAVPHGPGCVMTRRDTVPFKDGTGSMTVTVRATFAD